jgi:tetratricopeptide (TPR) repeat protein
MVIALVVLAPPWLSVRFAERALTKSSLDARGDLAWARRLDPLSVEPLLTEAVLAPSAKEALPSLRRAAEKEPRNVDVIFQLGLEHLRAGERGLARQRLEEALRLYPRSIAIRRAFRDAE